jgi:hypothetical protein
MPGLLPGAILYIIIPTGDGEFESAILHREAGMQGGLYGVLAILLAGHTGGMNMKTAVTGAVTGTMTDVIFRETDMMTGAMLKETDAMLKETDATLKKTGMQTAVIGTAVTGTETVVTGMVIDAIATR